MWRRSQLTRRRLWRLLELRLTDGTGTDSEGVTMTETLSKTNGTIRDLIRCRHAGNKEPDGKIVGQGQLIYENKDTFQVGTISSLSIIPCLIRASSKMGSSTVWACWPGQRWTAPGSRASGWTDFLRARWRTTALHKAGSKDTTRMEFLTASSGSLAPGKTKSQIERIGKITPKSGPTWKTPFAALVVIIAGCHEGGGGSDTTRAVDGLWARWQLQILILMIFYLILMRKTLYQNKRHFIILGRWNWIFRWTKLESWQGTTLPTSILTWEWHSR